MSVAENIQQDIAVLIPAFNEQRTVRGLVERALKQARHVIVVDDGSTDGTFEALQDLPILLLRHEINQGKAASLWSGICAARQLNVQGIATLDADGQHLPEDIPRLIACFQKTINTIVIGARLHDKASIPRARYNANQFANFWISWAAGQRIIDSQSGFRIYPVGLFDQVKVNHEKAASFVFESEILIEAARHDFNSVPVLVAAIYNKEARPSHFRPVVDIARIVRMVAWKLLSRGLFLHGLVRSLRMVSSKN